MTPVRWTPTLAITGLLLTPMVILAVVGPSALGLGTTRLTPGTTNHIEVVQTEHGLGLMAGLVMTESPKVLGIATGSPQAATAGWVVAHPTNQSFDPAAALTVTDRFSFEDPNGGSWEAIELSTPAGPAWVVPVGEVHHDATLEGAYNWAVVVDWDEVPEDQDVTVTYLEELDI